MARVFLVLLILLTLSLKVQANSCCGQSPASFTILSLQQKLNLGLSHSLVQSQGRIFGNPNQFFTWSNKDRSIQATRLDVAGTFRQHHQAFITTSFLNARYVDSLEQGHSQSFADTLLGYSYEVLPEYTFSYWKPIVFLTALVNVPTGRSIYDGSRLSEGGDVTGHNQWGMGAGITFKKVYYPLTVTLQARSLAMLPKDFGAVKVSGFFDSSVAVLGHYSSGLWNLAYNFGWTWSHLSPRELQSAGVLSGSSQTFTVLAGVQKALGDNLSIGLNYADQTLLGPARNSILNRTYSMGLNYSYF